MVMTSEEGGAIQLSAGRLRVFIKKTDFFVLVQIAKLASHCLEGYVRPKREKKGQIWV